MFLATIGNFFCEWEFDSGLFLSFCRFEITNIGRKSPKKKVYKVLEHLSSRALHSCTESERKVFYFRDFVLCSTV